MLRCMLSTVLIALAGCSASKVGVFSFPHLASDEPVEVMSREDLDDERTVEFRGHTFRFHLRNDVQTSETFWVGVEVPIIPLKRDRERAWRVPHAEGPYRIWIRVSPGVTGDAFRPRSVALDIDGVTYRPFSATHSALGEHRVVDPELDEGESVSLLSGREDDFVLSFDVERPEPDRVITLHMSDALITSDRASMPDVRFVMAKYSFAH
jgi:hypothetical protein